MISRAAILVFAHLLLFAALFPARGASDDYLLDVWTSERGLPDSSVSAIAQTPDGYLWVGTYNGLARFDGEHFTIFDPANTPELLHARIRKLFVDARGTLWINTYDGSLTTFRNGTFTLERRNTRASEAELALVSSSSSNIVFSTTRGGIMQKNLSSPPEKNWEETSLPNRGQGALFCEDRDGIIWARDHDGNLWRLQGNEFQAVPDSVGLLDQKVNCLATDSAGRLIVGTDAGIEFWDGTQFENMTPTNGMSSADVAFLFTGIENHLWVIADNLLRETTGRQWTSQFSNGMFNADIGRIGAQNDGRGGIWFYNLGRGLLHISADGHIQPIAKNALEQLNCFFQDREGNVWAGLDSGGLVRLREKQFHIVDEKSASLVRSICEDTNGAIWIGTVNRGLQRWQNGTLTNIPLPGGIQSVLAICADAKNRLWMSAGDDEELFVLENGRLRAFPEIRGVKAVLAGRDGRIWVGTRSGLYFADPPQDFQFQTNVPRHYIRALAEDENHALWIGAGNGDLYRVNNGQIETFHPTGASGSAAEAVWSLLAEKNKIWIGMFRGGLLQLQNGNLTRFNKQDGFPDNVICQILDDGRDYLWLGSHQGIFRVAKSDLEADAQGKISTLPCTVYGRNDGLPSLECSGGYQPGAWRDHEGRLWFATIRGAVYTEPSTIRKNLIPPTVVIEDLFVDGKNFQDGKWKTSGGALTIPPGARRFEFHFVGLSLSSPERVRYRYRLEGFEKDWVEGGTQRSVQYSLLQPGDYHFHVIACNSDGVWNEKGATLEIKILPHFYETWWFRSLMVILILGAVAGIVRHTATKRLREQMEELERKQMVERERARIAKDIHDDLGASLTLIAVLGDLAKKEKDAERIEKMSRTARDAVSSLDEIVWAVNPRNDTLAHLIDYTGQFATDYLRDAGVRCLLDVPDHAPEREVPANVRHNLFLVVKEALQNIVKHAHATEVWLHAHINGGILKIEIEDNGCGFDKPPESAWADGLRNMRQRLSEIQGDCKIQSSSGKGTAITIELKLPEQ